MNFNLVQQRNLGCSRQPYLRNLGNVIERISLWEEQFLLPLKEDRPTGIINLHNSDSLENETASWRLREIACFRPLESMCKLGVRALYSKTGTFGYSSAMFSRNAAATPENPPESSTTHCIPCQRDINKRTTLANRKRTQVQVKSCLIRHLCIDTCQAVKED